MVVQPSASASTGLWLAALSAGAHIASIHLMALLPNSLSMYQGLPLVYLPAGVVLVALLLARGWGLLGLALASLWTGADLWESAGPAALAAGAVLGLVVPYVAIRLMLRGLGIHQDLSNLSYLRALGICAVAIVATRLAGSAHLVWAQAQPLADVAARALAGALGNMLGAALVFALLIGVLNLRSAVHALDH